MFLADYAVVSDGKLTIVGGGWSQTGPEPASFGNVRTKDFARGLHETYAIFLAQPRQQRAIGGNSFEQLGGRFQLFG